MSDSPVHPRLVRRPLWRDRLLWVWLASLPLGYIVVYWLAENGGPLAPRSGAEEMSSAAAWARTVVLFLLVWSVAVVAVGLLVRAAGRRAEARLTRVIDGRQDRTA